MNVENFSATAQYPLTISCLKESTVNTIVAEVS